MTTIETDAEFGRRLAAEWRYVFNWSSRHLVGSNPEDLTQHAMMQAWKNREVVKAHPKQNLRAYLLTIARNLRYSEHRHEKLLSIISLDTDDLFPVTNDDLSQRTARGIMVSGGQEETVRLHDTIRVMSELPPEQAVTIVLLARGEQYDEAAAITNVAVGTTKSRVARGRRHLKEANV